MGADRACCAARTHCGFPGGFRWRLQNLPVLPRRAVPRSGCRPARPPPLPAKPAMGNARKPAVQINQPRRKDCRSVLGRVTVAQLLSRKRSVGSERVGRRAALQRWSGGTRGANAAHDDRDAQGSDPQSPAGAAEQTGEVPDREAGHRGSEDVALVERVDGADHEPGATEPARQDGGAKDDHAEGYRPADDEQLTQS